jgi:hypothetical protein
MKKFILSCAIFFNGSILIAQDTGTLGMQSEFNHVSKFASKQTGFEGVQTYSSKEVKGSQFFYPTWCKGSVTTNQKTNINNSMYVYLFDKVRQELFIKLKDSALVLQGDKSQIYSFTLTTDKNHLFETMSHFDPSQKNGFFEVLVKSDSGYTLLKQVKTTFLKADPTNMERMKEGENYDEFKDQVKYYISYKDGLPQSINLNEKSIRKAFPSSKTATIQDYFNQHNDDSINEQFVVMLVESLNN